MTALLGGMWLLALVRLVRSAHTPANGPDERLDERQQAVRDRAYLGAYRLVAAILLLGSV